MHSLSAVPEFDEYPDVSTVRLLKFKSFSAETGTLIPVTAQKDVPFGIKRVFFVLAPKLNGERGDHAHIVCQQVLMATSGACDVVVDDGQSTREFTLRTPDVALFIPALIWARQKYLTKDTVITVFCDQPYDERDYVRDYSAFRLLREPKAA